MWFFFGFITLISFTLYATYKHINASWTPHDSVRQGNDLEITQRYAVLGT